MLSHLPFSSVKFQLHLNTGSSCPRSQGSPRLPVPSQGEMPHLPLGWLSPGSVSMSKWALGQSDLATSPLGDRERGWNDILWAPPEKLACARGTHLSLPMPSLRSGHHHLVLPG